MNWFTISLLKGFLLFYFFLTWTQLVAQTINVLEVPESYSALYVPSKDKIYVLSFNPEGPAFASFLVVHPLEGTVEDIIPLSMELNITENMKLSADGKLIYMVSNSGDVLCFDIASSSVKFQFAITPLVQNFISGIRFLEVSPTDPNIYMIGWWERTSPAITAIFDGEQMRPNFLQTVNWAGVFPETDTLAYFTNSEGSLIKASVTANGLSEIETYSQILDVEFQNVAYFNGKLFVENGKVFDLREGDPQLLDKIILPFNNEFDSGNPTVVIDTSQQAVYYIHYKLEEITFYPFNLQNYEAGEAFVSPVRDGEALYAVVEPWGNEQNLALLVDFNTLLLVRNCTAQLSGNLSILADSLIEACPDQLVQLEASAVADQFLWSNGDTTRIIEVPFNQTLTVQAIDTTGCFSKPSNPVEVNYLPTPLQASIQLAGLTQNQIEICFGEEIILQAISSEDRYEWSNGDTLEITTVRTTGVYTIRAISDRDCPGPWSNPVEVIVKPDTLPSVPTLAIINGDSINCRGDLVELVVTSDESRFIWSDGLETNDPIRRLFFPGAQFSVSAVSETGCQGPFSDTLLIFFKPGPHQPIISADSNQLFSSFNNGNQWFFNGEAIEGAVDSIYMPMIPGFYSVHVTIADCTSPMSELYNYMITSTEETEEKKTGITVFPNPVKEVLSIRTALRVPIRLEIFTINGQKVDEKGIHNKKEFSVSHLEKGLYVLRFTAKKGEILKIQRIVVY